MGKENEKKRGQEKVLENKTGKGREKETKKKRTYTEINIWKCNKKEKPKGNKKDIKGKEIKIKKRKEITKTVGKYGK